ncbi:unnamed protein product, partial [Rotaria sp. Silwood2]
NTSNDSDSLNRAVCSHADLKTEICDLREANDQLNGNLALECKRNNQLTAFLTAEHLSIVAQLVDLMIQKLENEDVS